jgi:hypothetical protein
MKDVHRQRVQDYWRFANQRDWDGFGGLLHPDLVYEVPQTRERVRGQSAYIEFNRTYPGEWTAELASVVADEQQAVSKIRFHSDGQDCIGIAFFSFANGLISRIVDYWPEPYEPPKRLAPVVERY